MRCFIAKPGVKKRVSGMSCDSKFWEIHQNMKAEMSKIAKDNFEEISKLNNTVEINSELEKIAMDFINK
jgi:hypothetical protein